ncbi:MAG TPA: fibronectin type III domain-containing protein [Actinomycetes bacterium]|nr:fibronectin type III domain-containing protein [Actinomycetes bacterium]
MVAKVRRRAVKILAWSCSTLLAAALLVAAPLALAPATAANVSPPCKCIGDYVAPKTIEPTVADVEAPDDDGYSQNKAYRVAATTSSLQVIRQADNQTILKLPRPTQWGFSPDEQRFVTVSTQAMSLYNLADGSGSRLYESTNPQDENWGFSPHGKYLSSFSLPNQVPTLQVVDARTGNVVRLGGSSTATGYTDIGFSPSDDSLLAFSNSGATLYRLSDGVAVYTNTDPPSAYGFSPTGGYLEIKVVTNTTHVELSVVATVDGHPVHTNAYNFAVGAAVQQEASGFSPDEHTFLDAYVNGTDTASLEIVNLRDGRRVFSSSAIDRGSTWSFSPCGGEFAMAVPNGSRQTLTLRATSDGRTLGSALSVPVTALTIEATDDDNTVTYVDATGTQTITLAPNLWCGAATINHDNDVSGGDSRTWSIELDRPAHDYGVTFRLSSSDSHLTVPASATIPAGQTTVSFDVTSSVPPEDVLVTVTVAHDEVLGGTEASTFQVSIRGPVGLESLYLGTGEMSGPGTDTGSVYLVASAPTGGTTVSLASDDPAVSVPDTVIVAAGTDSATFPITVAAVDHTTTATVSATSGETTVSATYLVDPIVTTSTRLVVRPGTSTVVGEQVGLDATVTPIEPPADDQDWVSYYGTPTGTVTITDDGTELTSIDVTPPDFGGAEGQVTASWSIAALDAGQHIITVTYSGDDHYGPSQASATVTVREGLSWTGNGGDGRWSNPANWSPSRVPDAQNPDIVVISSATELHLDDDLPGLELSGLHLSGPITLDGQAIILDGELAATRSGATIGNDISLTIDTHNFYADTMLRLDGVVSGAGGPIASTASGGFVVLAGAANTYTGETRVSEGATLMAGADQALGARGASQGAEVYGTLCISRGVSLLEPVASHGGNVASCGTPDDLSATLADDPADVGSPTTATMSGSLLTDGTTGLGPLSCYADDPTGDELDLNVDGAISGSGQVSIGCPGRRDGPSMGSVSFGGEQPNTYTGGTQIFGTLTLAKGNGVPAAAGTLVAANGGTLKLAGDDQIGHSAHADVNILDAGPYHATVADLAVGVLKTVVDAAGHSGGVTVLGPTQLNSVQVSVASDPAIGSTFTVVDNTSSDPVGGCTNGVVPGDEATSYRIDCTGGDGNDVVLTTVWHPTVTLTTDPMDGAVSGSPVTVTATVSSPSGAAEATGQVSLKTFHFNYGWIYQATAATATLVDGVATFSFPDTSFLASGNGLVASYLGDSQHAPVNSRLMRYLSWPDPTGIPLPAAPVNLSAGVSGPGGSSPNTAFLSWGYPPGTTYTDYVSYHITVAPDHGEPYVVDTNTAQSDDDLIYRDFPGFPRYRLSGLQPGETYTFSVQAVNHAGAGPASNAVTVTVPVAPAPGAPTDLSAIAGPGQAQLAWTAPADDGGAPINGYEVTPVNDGVRQEAIRTADATTHLTVTGLTPGASYVFTVAAVHVGAVGPSSSPSVAVTPTAISAAAVVPGVPSDVVATPGPGSLTLTWSPPADDGGASIVHYVIVPSGTAGSRMQLVTSGPATTVTLSGLPDDLMTFTVAASNEAGTGPASAPTAPVRPVGAVPGASTDVLVSAGAGQVFVTWTPPADEGGSPIVRYLVTPYLAGAAQAPVATAGNGTSATVAGLLSDVPYTFTVSAVNAAGSGPASEQSAPVRPLSAPPIVSVPTAPETFTGSVDGQAVTLTWAPPSSNGGSAVAGYLVEAFKYAYSNYGEWGGGTYQGGPYQSWWLPADATSFNLTTDTISWPWTSGAYRFTVSAANDIGVGAQASPWFSAPAIWVAPPTEPGSGGGLPPEPTVPPGQNGDVSNGAGAGVHGSGFGPDEPVSATLHSTPVDLGTLTAAADGTVTGTVTIPADTPAGDHTIQLVGQNTGHVVDIPISVHQALSIGDITSSSMTVSWPSAPEGATGLTVSVDGSPVTTLSTTVSSYTVTGLSPATTHTLSVQASSGDSSLGELAIIGTTLSTLEASAAKTAVSLSWLASSDPTVTGYRVMRDDNADGDFDVLADVSGPSFTDFDLRASTTYRYHVLAVHADGSTSVWSESVAATTPDLAISNVSFSAPTALGGSNAAYGSTLDIEVTADAGRTASAVVSGQAPDGSAVSKTVALSETSSGAYDGTLPLNTTIATIDAITATLSDGVHSVDAEATGLPLAQSGFLSIEISPSNVDVAGAQLELVNTALGVDEMRAVVAPAHVGIAVAAGSWTLRLLAPDGDVLAERADVAVSNATMSSLSLAPVRHASLTVGLVAPDGETSGGFTVTVTDSDGAVLGQTDVASGDSSVEFDGLVAGTAVTVTATLDDASRPLLSAVSTTSTLAGGANTVSLVEQALSTGRIQGLVTPAATVVVDQQVDGRSWQFTTTTDSAGHFGIDVLAATAHVTASADGYLPATFDIDVAPSTTVTASPVALEPVGNSRVATRLTIDPISSPRDLMNLIFGRYKIQAHLVADDGSPIKGARVVIDSWKGPFCVAETHASGVASCDVPPSLRSVVLLGQVHASYAGSDKYLPSSSGDIVGPGWHGKDHLAA